MALNGGESGLRLGCQDGIKVFDQRGLEVLILGQGGEFQGRHPGRVFGIMGSGPRRGPAGHHVRGQLLADLHRRKPGRPVRECLGLRWGLPGTFAEHQVGERQYNQSTQSLLHNYPLTIIGKILFSSNNSVIDATRAWQNCGFLKIMVTIYYWTGTKESRGKY